MLAPSIEQCLGMFGEIENEVGGERQAAAVVGPSLITVRSWKRRKSMSVPSRRLVWLVWVLLLHPKHIRSLDDLVTWGRLRA